MRVYAICIELIVIVVISVRCEDYLKGATQRGLDYIRHIGLPFLEKEIGSLPIPDLAGTTSTPLGAISYVISSVRIQDVSIPKSNVTIDEKNGLTITCANAELKIKSNWKYKEKSWPHIKDSGSVNIHMIDIHLEITLFLDTHDESSPSIITRKCILGMGRVKVKFFGGASWLYNLFANAIASDLKGIVSQQVCHAVSKMIDEEGGKILREVPEVVATIREHINLFTHMGAGSFNDDT